MYFECNQIVSLTEEVCQVVANKIYSYFELKTVVRNKRNGDNETIKYNLETTKFWLLDE